MLSNSGHSIFKESQSLQFAHTYGYLLIDAGIETEVDRLSRYITENFKLNYPYFSYSLLENSYEQNKTIRQAIREILTSFFETHFNNYKTLNESFLIKPANTSEELLLHQDFCYTDENNFAAYNVWIPLTDVNENNGAVFVLPGSHLWYKNYRSSSLPTSRISTKKFLASQIQKVQMKKGQVLLFHPALFHGSYPNITNQNRVIVTATVTHKNADFVYYHQEENHTEVEVYNLDDDAYLRELKAISMKARPNAPLKQKFAYKHFEITETELLAKANEMGTSALYDQ
jgi:hypothetical protein